MRIAESAAFSQLPPLPPRQFKGDILPARSTFYGKVRPYRNRFRACGPARGDSSSQIRQATSRLLKDLKWSRRRHQHGYHPSKTIREAVLHLSGFYYQNNLRAVNYA